MGIIPRRLPFTASNTSVRYFRHAISLDEHRAKFRPTHWNYTSPKEAKRHVQRGDMARHRHMREELKKLDVRDSEYYEDNDDKDWETDVYEVWFAGCHCGRLYARHCTCTLLT